MEENKTSKEWYSTIQSGITIIDPDGWDRSNYEYSFNKEKITKEEFKKRLYASTLQTSKVAMEIFEQEFQLE